MFDINGNNKIIITIENNNYLCPKVEHIVKLKKALLIGSKISGIYKIKIKKGSCSNYSN